MSAPQQGAPARRLWAAVALLAGGVLLLLWSAGRIWAAATVRHPVAGTFLLVHRSVSGHSVTGVTTAAGVVGLAGLAGLAATRGRARSAVGGALAASGLAAAGASLAALAGPPAGLAPTGWPAVSAVGGAALALAGLFAVRHGRRWPVMSGRRYSRAAPPRAPASLWEALDAGEDPTAPALHGSKAESHPPRGHPG